MRTTFTAARLADPDLREADAILRRCVHCGFCLATCPTYLIRGDERDSPRGRIYLAKAMLETGQPPTAGVVRHIDRCLTCRGCETTCPSGVAYGHLIDRARVHIAATYRRPLADRLLRRLLAVIVPRPGLLRIAGAIGGGRLIRRLRVRLPARLGALLAAAPDRIAPPSPVDQPQVFAAEGTRRLRVVLMTGCVQQVMRPEINEATVRILRRHGCEVVVAPGAGCCGAIAHQLGREADARAAARANVAAWSREMERGGLDAVVSNASGCAVAVKDYAHLLRSDPQWAETATRIGGLVRDVSEVLLALGLKPQPDSAAAGQRVTYLLACTMQHGLGLKAGAKPLLTAAGFTVAEPAEPHICCGSAGAYSILEPELAGTLRERKLRAIAATQPEIICADNIGCITHLAAATAVPVVHTVQLLDWATGGPAPRRQ